MSTLVQIPQPQLHVYQWLLPLEASTELLHATRETVSHDAQLMKAPNLHCSAHITCERDETFESEFFSDVNDELFVAILFCGRLCSASYVALTPDQEKFFSVVDSVPHLSLAKGPDDEWKDLGPFVADCLSASDWQFDQSRRLYSPSLGVYKT